VSAIVLSGFGCLGGYGVGRAALARALATGRAETTEVDRSAGFHDARSSRQIALVPGAVLKAQVPPALTRRMGQPSRLAVAALRLALADAGLDETTTDFSRTAIVMSTAFGPVRITEQLLDAILHRGPEQASPAHFTEAVASAPASQMALYCRALGPNLTLTQRKAGPLLAVAEGLRLLSRGRADRVLVGTVEEMSPLLHSVLDRFRALARPDRVGVELARPFDRLRNGALAAEGATVWVLEQEATAAARGAVGRARVEAAWGAFDPAASPVGWSRDPAPLAAALSDGLSRHHLEIGPGDRIVAGASGAVGGDRLEALVLRAALGDPALPPVLAPKGTLGEFGGGFLAALALAASGDASWPTAGFTTVDPGLALVPHDGAPLPPPRRILASSLAAGGAAAWAVLSPAAR